MVANHFSIAILKSFNPVILNRYRSIQLTLMVANQVSIPVQKSFNPVISNGYWSIWLTFIVANHNIYFILFNYLINSHYLCHIHQHDWNKTKWELIKLSCLQGTKYLLSTWNLILSSSSSSLSHSEVLFYINRLSNQLLSCRNIIHSYHMYLYKNPIHLFILNIIIHFKFFILIHSKYTI
jgi:hypothetical protein